MRISIQWLKQFVDIQESPGELADVLSMIGLEAEVATDLGELPGVIIGEIRKVKDHPNADKLKLCDVYNGTETVSVVCGAPNVQAGQKVPFAQVGSILPGNFKIKKAKIRGEVSHGMICAADELGISDDHEGIMVLNPDSETGKPFVDDYGDILAAIEIDLTPNRPDALHHYGVARDLAVKTGRTLKPLDIRQVNPPSSPAESLEVKIDDPQGCPRYLAGIVTNVKVGPSPHWMQDRLKAAGQRPINNLVDISNYVLFEMGHPTHIFDLKRFGSNTVLVRKARKNETFVTLDEETRKLSADHLLITNGKEPVALAGIMGGENSAVSEDTTTVLIESAYFDPVTIRKGAKNLGMLTDSSRRFERGADPEAVTTAFMRIVNLLEDYAEGTLVSDIVDEYPNKIQVPTIQLRQSEINLIAGIDIGPDFVLSTLKSLGVTVSPSGESFWSCVPPSYRPDLEREIDLIEEIVRIYGYDRIPSQSRYGGLLQIQESDPMEPLTTIQQVLRGMGFRQSYNNSLLSKTWAESSGIEPVEMINPLTTQMSTLRTSLYPGLLQNIDFNIKNGISDLMLFETGKVHAQTSPGFDGITEHQILTVMVHGNYDSGNIHHRQPRSHNYYSLRGFLETFVNGVLHKKPSCSKARRPEFSVCYAVTFGQGSKIKPGVIGEISPEYVKFLKLETGSVYAFSLDLDGLIQALKSKRFYESPSVYPKVDRDLNLVMDDDLEAGDIMAAMEANGKGLLQSVTAMNLYRDPQQLGQEKKSLLFRLVFQSPERTLEDKEVNSIVDKIIRFVDKEYGAKLRS